MGDYSTSKQVSKPRQRGLSLGGCPLSNIELYYSEPLEETGNGTVYGTIQDGGGNGLVVLNPPERAKPSERMF